MGNRTKLATLILGAALMVGAGATTLLAEDGKCGAGKCGGEKKEKAAKCGDGKEEKKAKCGAGKCGSK